MSKVKDYEPLLISDLMLMQPGFLVSHHLETFEQLTDIFIKSIMKRRLEDVKFTIHRKEIGKIFKCRLYYIDGPIFQTKTPMGPEISKEGKIIATTKNLFPTYCRKYDFSYHIPLNCIIGMETQIFDEMKKTKPKTVITKNNVEIISLPIMVKSSHCNLYGRSEKDMLALGEDPMEVGGYFVLSGSEKIIVNQEALKVNYPFYKRHSDKFDHRTTIKSRENGEFDVRFGTSVDFNYSTKKFTVEIKLPKKQKYDSVPMALMFRLFGFNNDIDILNCIIGKDIRNKKLLTYQDEVMISYLLPSLKTYVRFPDGTTKYIIDKDDALTYLALTYMPKENMKALKNDITKIKIQFKGFIDHRVLPHINDEKLYGKNIDLMKGLYLGFVMVRKTLKGIIGTQKLFDKYSFVNKTIVTSGILMVQIIKLCFDQMVSSMVEGIKNKLISVKEDNIEKILNTIMSGSDSREKFNKALKHAIMTGNWQIRSYSGMTRTGVTQQVEPLSALNMLSQKRKIEATLMTKHANTKSTTIRNLHTSSYGYLDPAETPEGDKIGLLKTMSLTTKISLHRDDNQIIDIVKNDETIKNNITFSDKIISGAIFYNNTLIFLNGKILGITNKAPIIHYRLVEMRRKMLLPFDVGIIFDRFENEIRINCNIGRLIRPVIIVDPGNKPRFTREIAEEITHMTWGEFLSKGIIEYIDPEEQETNTRIALYISDVYAADWEIDKYTHCEIHPALHLGTSCSIIPFMEHDPATRILFQSNMGKQAIGIPAFNFSERFDTSSNVSLKLERPLVSTIGSKYVGYELSPQGHNLMVLIGTYTGFNQEDSLILRKNAIERGVLFTILYKTYKDMLESNDQNYVKYTKGREDILGRRDPKKYAKLNYKTGIIEEGTYVEYDDVMAFKLQEISDIETGKRRYRDISVFYKDKFPGIVDKVIKYQNGDGNTCIKIRVKIARKLQVGDKFACFDGKTDILTKNGWKKFKKLNPKDKVAALSDENDISFLPYENYVNQEYDGEMFMVDNYKTSFCVTENHNMWIKLPNSKEFEFVKAKNLKKYPYFYIQKGCDGIYTKDVNRKKDKIPKNVKVNDVNYDIKPFLKLLGCIYIGGKIVHVHKKFITDIKFDKNIKYVKVIKFVMNKFNQLKMKYIRSICQELGIKMYVDNFIYKIADKIDMEKIPDFILKLPKDYQREFINGFCHGFPSKTKLIMLKNKNIADKVQQIAINCGFSSDCNIKANTEGIEYFDKYYYVLKIMTSMSYVKILKKHVKRIKAKKRVFCVEVKPYHRIMVRRNGYSMWCGQSRHGQKGTCSQIMYDTDMPFTKEGLMPDIIVNPHAFPSRMTIGMMLEMLSGIIGTKFYTCIDATAFMKTDVKNIVKKLEESGVKDMGNRTFYSGFTGKKIRTKMFFGPCFYQRLKHMIDDKIHSRNYGKRKLKSRQPTEGRGKGGGMRIGIMEKDAIAAHGVSKLLWEKYMFCSDGIPVFFCDNCGMKAIANEDINLYKCNNCKNPKIKKYHMPYCMANLVMSELEGMNIFMRVFSEDSKIASEKK